MFGLDDNGVDNDLSGWGSDDWVDDWGISSDDDWFDNFLGYDDDSS